jgi:hypothetical protein
MMAPTVMRGLKKNTVLKDHLQFSCEPSLLLVMEAMFLPLKNLSPGGGQKADGAIAGRRLAAARLADQTQRFEPIHIKRNVVYGLTDFGSTLTALHRKYFLIF